SRVDFGKSLTGQTRRTWEGFGYDFLDAVAADSLAYVDVALRINRHHVQEGERPWIVSRAAESGEDRLGIRPRQRAGAIEGPQNLIAAVRDEREGLRRVFREVDVPCRAVTARRVGNDGNVAYERTVSLIHVDLVLTSIAGVDQLVPTQPDAVR